MLHAVVAHALPRVTLWVVQPPGELVAFEVSDFSRVGGVRIPAAAFFDPSRLAVNAHGQILAQVNDERLWLWDGAHARTLPVAPILPERWAPPSTTHRAPLRQWLLGDDGRSLFCLASEVAPRRMILMGSESAPNPDTTSTFLSLLETDLAQQPRALVFSKRRPSCMRGIHLLGAGATCPEPEVWARNGAVKEGCFLTEWIQQQPWDPRGEVTPLSAMRRTCFRRDSSGWHGSEISGWLAERLLDASANGRAWVTTGEDDGCCGWSNVSSEPTAFSTPAGAVMLRDEWTSFQNREYDVSLSTSEARISPAGDRVALGSRASSFAGLPGPRLSSGGHADSLELEAFRSMLRQMPLVDVVDVKSPGAPVLRVPRAELVGWTNESELLVLEEHHLVAIDVTSGRRRPTGIELRSIRDAFVVWR